MECVACGGTTISERPERTAQGYRRFRCRECGKQFNERTGLVSMEMVEIWPTLRCGVVV